jgi:hypothetical protein
MSAQDPRTNSWLPRRICGCRFGCPARLRLNRRGKQGSSAIRRRFLASIPGSRHGALLERRIPPVGEPVASGLRHRLRSRIPNDQRRSRDGGETANSQKCDAAVGWSPDGTANGNRTGVPRVVFTPCSDAGRHASARPNPWQPASATRRLVDDAGRDRRLFEVDAREILNPTPKTPIPGESSNSRIPPTQRARTRRLDLCCTDIASLAADFPRATSVSGPVAMTIDQPSRSWTSFNLATMSISWEQVGRQSPHPTQDVPFRDKPAYSRRARSRSR